MNIIFPHTDFLIRCLRMFSCLLLILVSMSFGFSFRFLLCSAVLCLVVNPYLCCFGSFLYQWRDYWLFAAMQEIWYYIAKLSLTECSCLWILCLASGKKIFATAGSLSLSVVCYLINQRFNISSRVGANIVTISTISKKNTMTFHDISEKTWVLLFLYSFYTVWNSECAVCRGI